MSTKHTNNDKKVAVLIKENEELIVDFRAIKKGDLFNIMLSNGKIGDILWEATDNSKLQLDGTWSIYATEYKK